MINEKTIYKICGQNEWNNAQKNGIYLGSQDDLRDGFIHFSSKVQVEGTLAKHFKDKKDLLLLEIEVDKLPTDELKWEVSRNGEKFPHLYGDLNLEAVIKVTDIPNNR
ncbi:MAG: DUF952 domain-containing protein [Emcibacteraceae bacterium]|nr:DUF952 domain-containing protein [Emcibacteraceae bacterium]MDG1859874.1 DUF952 domain-containing protein [Emcibacteraceae bacterium]